MYQESGTLRDLSCERETGRDWKKLNYLVLPLAAMLLSFALGRYPVSPRQLAELVAARLFLVDAGPWDVLHTVVFKVRLPRILAAMLIGASLSASGACYQGLFRNPLASPALLGAAAGAGFGATLGICLSLRVVGIQALAFFISLGAVGLTCLLSGKIRHDRTLGLVLAGIMTGSLFTAATSFLKYVADPYDKLPTITFWLMGSLSSITMSDVGFVAVPVFLGLVPLFLIRWRLNVLSLGDEEATALGLNVMRYKLLVIVCATLVTAASVSVSGMIGWVGLVIPHLARVLVGPDYKDLYPASIVAGGVFLLLVDDLARILASVEIPLGVLTALIGVPFFLFLLLRERGALR